MQKPQRSPTNFREVDVPISITCAACGKSYRVKDELAGKTAKCACGEKIVVPAADPLVGLDDLSQFSAPASSPLPPASFAAPRASSPSRADRAANIRRNLKRWWKILALLAGGWLLVTILVCGGAIGYAVSNHLSERRVQSLGQGLGTIMAIVFGVLMFTVLFLADRKQTP